MRSPTQTRRFGTHLFAPTARPVVAGLRKAWCSTPPLSAAPTHGTPALPEQADLTRKAPVSDTASPLHSEDQHSPPAEHTPAPALASRLPEAGEPIGPLLRQTDFPGAAPLERSTPHSSPATTLPHTAPPLAA